MLPLPIGSNLPWFFHKTTMPLEEAGGKVGGRILFAYILWRAHLGVQRAHHDKGTLLGDPSSFGVIVEYADSTRDGNEYCLCP